LFWFSFNDCFVSLEPGGSSKLLHDLCCFNFSRLSLKLLLSSTCFQDMKLGKLGSLRKKTHNSPLILSFAFTYYIKLKISWLDVE